MSIRQVRDDAGFTTVAALGLVLVLGAVTALAAVLATLGALRHEAEGAADLAALAAAGHLLEGPSAACAAAREVARSRSTSLESCELQGSDVVVRVRLELPGRLRPLGPIVARARAGSR
jgi:secretion/DNA translocation related TadE-like protein